MDVMENEAHEVDHSLVAPYLHLPLDQSGTVRAERDGTEQTGRREGDGTERNVAEEYRQNGQQDEARQNGRNGQTDGTD